MARKRPARREKSSVADFESAHLSEDTSHFPDSRYCSDSASYEVESDPNDDDEEYVNDRHSTPNQKVKHAYPKRRNRISQRSSEDDDEYNVSDESSDDYNPPSSRTRKTQKTSREKNGAPKRRKATRSTRSQKEKNENPEEEEWDPSVVDDDESYGSTSESSDHLSKRRNMPKRTRGRKNNVTRKTKRNGRFATKKMSTDSEEEILESSEDEDYKSNGDSSDDYNPPSSTRKTTSQKTRRKGIRSSPRQRPQHLVRKVRSSSETSKTLPSKRTTRGSSRKPVQKKDENEDKDHIDGEVKNENKRSEKRKHDDEDEEHNDEEEKKKNNKISKNSKYVDEDEDEDEEHIDINESNENNSNTKERKYDDDDDDDFVPGDEEDQSDMNEDDYSVEKSPVVSHNIDESSFLDENSGEEDFFSDSEKSTSDCATSKKRRENKNGKGIKPHCCPSKVDAITQDPVPAIHVCWIAPDKKSRQCFSLETLRKVALASGTTASTRGPNNERLLLQPPHFRSIMSDELKQQIVDKFGEGGLNLYPKNLEEEGSTKNDHFGLIDSDVPFRAELDRYMHNQMGHHDLYCCPLCYIEADWRLKQKHNDQDEDAESDEDDINEEGGQDYYDFDEDPMTILGSMDNDEYLLASTICFQKVSETKAHLKNAHNIDCSVLYGNELFRKFQIRQGDGLLQRYLSRRYGKDSLVGDMRRYWAEGFSYEFNFLLALLIERRDGNQTNSSIEEHSSEFISSFQTRAVNTWQRISGPFLKDEDDEDDDFIINSEAEQGITICPFIHEENEEHFEDAFIKELKKRRGKDVNNSSDEESSNKKDICHTDDEEDDLHLEDTDTQNHATVKRSIKTPKVSFSPSIVTQTPISEKKRRRILEDDDDDY